MTEVYGWTIEEKGEPGKGARFVIKIPRNKYKWKGKLSNSAAIELHPFSSEYMYS